MNICSALWSYWDTPKPKVRLGKTEPEKVSNGEAILFCIKFTVLAIAIYFLILFVRMIL